MISEKGHAVIWEMKTMFDNQANAETPASVKDRYNSKEVRKKIRFRVPLIAAVIRPAFSPLLKNLHPTCNAHSLAYENYD